MSQSDIAPTEMARWDPGLVKRAITVVRPVAKRYFRSEVRGLNAIPPGGALVVSNHSGGLFTMDVAAFAVDFYDTFGYERPIYTLSHEYILRGPPGQLFVRLGFIRASRDNATAALRSGGIVIDFPGGEYDVYRPTRAQDVIDFHGRTGYVTTAIQAGVPIVPMVSIGAQENQIYLSRGTWLAHLLRLDKLPRASFLPISFGFPFGLSAVIPINLPLPTKIVTEVLEPIDIAAQFGTNADPIEVDGHVRALMQEALDKLAAERRFPILG
jgi:1-acyl-sn-glycerol-3-phosphate acyltransferase